MPLAASQSVRGSRAGELVARCIVETATGSYYSALAEAADEPVLKAICQRIAADEIRDYKLFHIHLERYLASEGLGFWGRLKVVLGRIAETEDDELAFAYHAANDPTLPYDRRPGARACAARLRALSRHHVEHGIALVFKTLGLKRSGRLDHIAARLAWWGVRRRVARLGAAGVTIGASRAPSARDPTGRVGPPLRKCLGECEQRLVRSSACRTS